MCVFFASPFEFRIQITRQKNVILRKVDFEGYSSIDLNSFCTRSLVSSYGTRVELHPVQNPEVSCEFSPYKTFSAYTLIFVHLVMKQATSLLLRAVIYIHHCREILMILFRSMVIQFARCRCQIKRGF